MTNGSTVLYDACVFYPNHLRDILMQLATTELFAAKWTEQIHDEWMRNLRHNRPDIDTDKLETLKQRINQSVPDCLIKDFEHIRYFLRKVIPVEGPPFYGNNSIAPIRHTVVSPRLGYRVYISQREWLKLLKSLGFNMTCPGFPLARVTVYTHLGLRLIILHYPP